MKALLPFSVLMLSLLLHGCFAAAIIGSVAVSTRVTSDPRTLGRQFDDSILKLYIKKALLNDNQLKKKVNINVEVYQGIVLLVGQAPNLSLSLRAKKIAMSIAKTTRVLNEIRQNKPIGINTVLLDNWVTIKIYFKLLMERHIKFSNIKVITEDGEVFLFGLITGQHEGEVAANIASRIKGVKHVIKIFTHMHSF